MNLGAWKNRLFSIHIKIFLGFWLVALLSILITRIISAHLGDNKMMLAPHPGDSEFLQHLSLKIKSKPTSSLSTLMRKHKKHRRRALVFKDLISNDIITSSRRKLPALENFVQNRSFKKPVTVEFPLARLTGPELIQVNSKHYQMFIASLHRKPSFERYMMLIPIWAKLSITAVVSFILCWLLARSISRPLRNIEQAAAKLGDGQLDTRINKIDTRKDELGSLAQSFNQMATKLETSVAAQQRLLGDVSHELRSPMTRLQLALALAQKAKLTPDELEKYLQRCETEVTRLDEMIADVLSLSRIENSLHLFKGEKLDVAALITLVIQDNQFIADEKAITIQCSKIDSLFIEVDSQLFTSALTNILTNAIKYSPKASKIFVCVESVENELIIKVIDNGPGVPEKALEHLFKPFYRVSDARERATGGTGLGLAIAKQAITAYHGTINATNNKEQGLTVIITLPIKYKIDNIN